MLREEEAMLVRRAARGDSAAAEALIRRHQAGVQSYIYRLCGRFDVAQDVTQEAFVRALAGMRNFDPTFRFSTWLFTIARRVWLNLCEKKKACSAGDACDSWEVGAGRGTSTSSDVLATLRPDDEQRDLARDALQGALMLLSEEQRETIVLFHQMDWPIRLIAEHMDLPEGTVKSHLHRGRQRLREELVRGVGEVVAIEDSGRTLPTFARIPARQGASR